MHLKNVYSPRGNLEKILKALKVYAENIQHMKMKMIIKMKMELSLAFLLRTKAEDNDCFSAV